MIETTFMPQQALNRLRKAAGLAKQACGLPKNSPCEIGLRVIPMRTDTMPTTQAEAHEVCYPEGDDLNYHVTLQEHAFDLQPGEVLHMYLSKRDGYGYELYDTVCVWVGNADNEPAVIDNRFVPYEMDRAAHRRKYH